MKLMILSRELVHLPQSVELVSRGMYSVHVVCDISLLVHLPQSVELVSRGVYSVHDMCDISLLLKH